VEMLAMRDASCTSPTFVREGNSAV
jgi:hypothetical protein